ncbi:Heavy-metal resistance [Desulfacinum hydrothermale DSM 13146]|uniref:Heavy-metal resistance n=1 Tax=Desulfacinum hydrothermale DSM 13146 TaxID=1121390 RepID=A0A1W1XDE8_9BACT|nr:periplasmic heavy metal sensor [Desulfacinum hydrothermale]SMC21900.1 Heavy-metal resistance [Desulfacinum hydrothermale DSM 13146]
METKEMETTSQGRDPSIRAWLGAALVWLLAVGALHAGAGKALGHPPPPPPDVDTMIRHMDRELNLTADQKEKLRAIFEEAQQKAQELRERSQADGSGFEAVKAQMDQLRDETEARIKEVLRADQYEKWQEMRKERETRRGPRPGRRD